MARRIITSSIPKRLPNADDLASLDEQLASVVEQEGKLIITSRGVRKRKKTEGGSIFSLLSEQRTSIQIEEDAIAELDQKTLANLTQIVRPTGSTRSKAITIRFGEHERSPYVLSLQTIGLTTPIRAADERVKAAEGAREAEMKGVLARPPEVYATMSTDLSHTDAPHATADQQTAETFEEAYAAVYGKPHVVGSFLRDAGAVVASWFHRVERVEVEMAEEAHEAMAVLDMPRISFARACVGFAAFALIVTLPAHAVALYRSASAQETTASDAGHAALAELSVAKDAGSIPTSAEALKNASSRFREADAALSDASALALGLASLLPKEYRSARALLEVGDKSSEAVRLLALGLDKVFSDGSRRLDERLDVMGAHAQAALVLLSDASKAASSVDLKVIPEDKREQVTKLLSELDQSTQAVREFVALSDLLSVMVGKNSQRNYLVIFQNHTELRPTGGFMGSFAEVVMDQGSVKAVKVPPGGTYAIKGQLLARIAPPKPMQLINSLWQFQDSNWSPDFPTAANKIKWFWSMAGQPTVDGVIALNATFIEQVLAMTGPLEMPEYGKTITADNFLLETQKAVELEYDKEANTPKKFIGDLGDKLMKRLTSLPQEDWMKMVALVSQALTTKDIQIALSEPSEEAIAERYGWSGRMKESAGDELAIIETNIAGQKTDGMVTEKVDHHVTVSDDGSMSTALTLTRSHTGIKGELFRGVRNVSYVRFYVPKGSVLISASGFQTPDAGLFKKIDEETGMDPDIATSESQAETRPDGVTVSTEGDRTVFGGWMQLDPGATQEIVLSYQLPFSVYDILSRAEAAPERTADAKRGAYLLLLTSQSGKSTRELHSTVTLPKDWTLSWSREPSAEDPNGLGYSGIWNRDLVLAAVLTPPHAQSSAH